MKGRCVPQLESRNETQIRHSPDGERRLYLEEMASPEGEWQDLYLPLLMHFRVQGQERGNVTWGMHSRSGTYHAGLRLVIETRTLI